MDIEYLLKTFQISSETDKPLYEQLASYLQMQIRMGTMKPGDKMIPEEEIAKALGMSRTTVRQAMDRLSEQGLIQRYRRKGTFVTKPQLKRPINYLYNFTENMRGLGVNPTSRVISAAVENAAEEIAAHLQLPNSQMQVFHLVRLRCAEDDPILYENSYIPYYLCPGIEHIDFRVNSLYHILSAQYGLNLYHATETIEAICISEQDAELLQCDDNSPGYRITRISNLDTGYIFEYTSSVTLAERCVFQLELYKNSSASKNPLDFKRQVSLP